MENQEHLILKQGAARWNQWRKDHPEVIHLDLRETDLSGADLYQTNLSGANLSGAHLSGAHLSDAHLEGTHLDGADLSRADLHGAHLSEADLFDADLSGAHLEGADLSRADLSGADFYRTNLSGADLSRADLHGANLEKIILSEANLSGATVESTHFADLDLRQVKGLDTLKHQGPSHISISTIYRSEGHLPEEFLRQAGVPDSFIDYMRSLVVKPIDYYTCFISYSSKDQAFADRLYVDLQSKGVRCWFAPEDMKIGDNIHVRIDESIRLYDKLLLVLSEHAITSTWVEREVSAALEKEQQQSQRVLFPIRLDESVMQASQAWAADIRRRKHIGDFTKWKKHDDYQEALERLLRDLQAEV